VSWRAKDVLPLMVGAYLMLLGAVYLLDSTGARTLGFAGMAGAAIGLAAIALGVLALIAAWRVHRIARRLRRAIGHVRSDREGWTLENAVISTVVGDIALDLSRAQLPLGATELTLLCWLGTIHVWVPRELGVDVTAQAIVGSVDILGRREEGFVRDIRVRSEGYEHAASRLQMRLSTVVGELLVAQV